MIGVGRPCVGMSRAIPLFKRNVVNACARAFVNDDLWGHDLDHALEVINNWRSSHSFPLNTFAVRLRRKGREIDPDCLVAQRIKRLSSIVHKIKRFPTISLSQMQDIGGCRVVLTTCDDVRELVKVYSVGSDIKHTLLRTDDYISNPQGSGYRGVHLIFKYYSDKNAVYNDLKIEMQIRSQFMHAWATAVETVGTFQRQALKSSIGEERWLRFFALMGTAIAFQEGTAPVEGTPGDSETLIAELCEVAEQLDVVTKLRAYGGALQYLEHTKDADFYILVLDPDAKATTIYGYPRRALADAQARYLEIERGLSEHPGTDAVLVSVDSVVALQRAYPNYFLDTTVFIGLVEDVLAERPLANTAISEPHLAPKA